MFQEDDIFFTYLESLMFSRESRDTLCIKSRLYIAFPKLTVLKVLHCLE